MNYVVTITKTNYADEEEVVYENEFEYPDDMDEEEVVDEILYQLGQEGGLH